MINIYLQWRFGLLGEYKEYDERAEMRMDQPFKKQMKAVNWIEKFDVNKQNAFSPGGGEEGAYYQK